MAFIKNHFYTITIPPLLPILLSYIVGIMWQACIISTPIVMILYTLITLIHFLQSTYPMTSFFQPLLYFLFFSSGALIYKQKINKYHHFYSFANNSPVSITGVICDINNTTVCNKKTTVTTLNVHSITKNKTTHHTNKYCLLYGHKNNTFEVGDTITFFNIICKKPKNEEIEFYFIKENIIATIFDKNIQYTITDRPAMSWKKWIFSLRHTLLSRCKEKLSPQTFLLFTSLFLGNRSYVKDSMDAINEHFKRWGIFHFISRSGLHLALFICTWQLCFYYIPLPFIIKNILLIIISIIYALLSWSSLPFTRSLVLLFCNKISFISQTSYHLVHYLTLICLCFLLYNPFYLFFLDFQLTFGITFALAWFNQLQNQHLYQETLHKKSNY